MFWPAFVILSYDWKGTAGSTTNLRPKFLMDVLWEASNDKSLLGIDITLVNSLPTKARISYISLSQTCNKVNSQQ
jgi:hypothetical protein